MLSGGLACAILVAVVLSACHALHQYFHEDGGTTGHICLACSMAKGQVSAAAVVLVAVLLTCACFWTIRPVNLLPFTGFDYCVTLSRGPPPA